MKFILSPQELESSWILMSYQLHNDEGGGNVLLSPV